ncbi:MAG TPA: hypothetical protein VD947_03115 [Patescibacteria group bacterium]|nr:hypothetical protein [Patescibacteria group bacterium]
MVNKKEPQDSPDLKEQYKAGYILLEALAELEDDLKHNYEKGTGNSVPSQI